MLYCVFSSLFIDSWTKEGIDLFLQSLDWEEDPNKGSSKKLVVCKSQNAKISIFVCLPYSRNFFLVVGINKVHLCLLIQEYQCIKIHINKINKSLLCMGVFCNDCNQFFYVVKKFKRNTFYCLYLYKFDKTE